MAIVSSHILDAVAGDHAGGIRVELFRLAGTARQRLFERVTGADGRVSETVDVRQGDAADQYELVFHSADYFTGTGTAGSAGQILQAVVVRLALPDAGAHYHVPLVLAPHAYTIWWSA